MARVPQGADLVIDCRGLAAKDELPTLRGVRGERIVVRAPRDRHRRGPCACSIRAFRSTSCLGATAFSWSAPRRSSARTPAPSRLRSALDLLSAAYVLDPAFGEAEILALGAGVRPAFPDNRPRIIAAKGYIYVNGLYRHGFLLAPVMAELVADLSRDRRHRPGGVRCRSCSTVSASPPTPATLDELCAQLGFAEAKIATAVNGSFVAARRARATPLADADEVEIVAPRQGG